MTAGLHPGSVEGNRKTRLQPDALIDDLLTQEFDMIALPGGMPGAENLKNDARIQSRLDGPGRAAGWKTDDQFSALSGQAGNSG
ncbi:MAG: DJ-1/PfpI family protein [Betaproteobacteria bacterium]|nr:DJ-1/PfpI family protein [Betaproteobacteria bacterium]